MKQSIIIAIALLTSTAAVLFFVVPRIDRALDLRALADCAIAYRTEYTNDKNVTIVRPLEQQVKECAWNKGVRNWTGVWSGIERIPQ